MNTKNTLLIIATWFEWCRATEVPTPYNHNEPRIPRKYWVDENNNRLYPEL